MDPQSMTPNAWDILFRVDFWNLPLVAALCCLFCKTVCLWVITYVADCFTYLRWAVVSYHPRAFDDLCLKADFLHGIFRYHPTRELRELMRADGFEVPDPIDFEDAVPWRSRRAIRATSGKESSPPGSSGDRRA